MPKLRLGSISLQMPEQRIGHIRPGCITHQNVRKPDLDADSLRELVDSPLWDCSTYWFVQDLSADGPSQARS